MNLLEAIEISKRTGKFFRREGWTTSIRVKENNIIEFKDADFRVFEELVKTEDNSIKTYETLQSVRNIIANDYIIEEN